MESASRCDLRSSARRALGINVMAETSIHGSGSQKPLTAPLVRRRMVSFVAAISALMATHQKLKQSMRFLGPKKSGGKKHATVQGS
eukprot:4092417-Karenia_brevis.AAC.1